MRFRRHSSHFAAIGEPPGLSLGSVARSWRGLDRSIFPGQRLYSELMMTRQGIARTSQNSPVAWSVPVRLDDVPESGLRLELSPDPAIRPALARAAGVDEVPRLRARFDLIRQGHDGLRVTGHGSATLRPIFVVTLE